MKSLQADYHCNELSAYQYYVISKDMSHSVWAISNDEKTSWVISVQDDKTDQRSRWSTFFKKYWALSQALTRTQTEDIKVSENDTHYCR